MPFLFCNIGWMSQYEGLIGKPDKIVGGGTYVDENKTGGEICNFLKCSSGYTYGHVETLQKEKDRSIKIEALGVDRHAKHIDGVTVVWTATHPDEGGRRVIGWYQNARVYRDRQPFENNPSPQHRKDDLGNFRIRAKNKDARLLPLGERHLRLGTGKDWMGHAQWWFPHLHEGREIKSFMQEVARLIDAPGGGGGQQRKWGGGEQDLDRKLEVEQAAIDLVKAHFSASLGSTVTSVEGDNVGWDLEVKPQRGERLQLEVKGLFGSDLQIGLTPREYVAFEAHRNGTKNGYRLCIVTNALGDKPILRILRHRIATGQWHDEAANASYPLKIDIVQSAIVSSSARDV